MDREKHSFVPGAVKGCNHRHLEPPWGNLTRAKNGEMRRCPSCLKWWKADRRFDFVWHPVGMFDFKARRHIKEFEARERNQMHILVDADRKVED